MINCEGDTLQVAQYVSLFKILGTTFGGDGVTTFDLPDTRFVPPFRSVPVPSPFEYSIANVPIGSTGKGFVGEIKILPSTVPPNGWLQCDGSLLPIEDPYLTLFSFLGADYGGDGKTTFALPNTEVPEGLQGFICQLGVYPPPP